MLAFMYLPRLVTYCRLPTVIFQDPLHRVLRELGYILQLQSLLDSLAVRIDRLGTEAELAGDLPRGQALPDHLKDLDFPVGESLDRRLAGMRLRSNRKLHHPLGSPLAQIHLTVQHLANRLDNAAAHLLLVHITERAGSQGALCKDELIVHRQD